MGGTLSACYQRRENKMQMVFSLECPALYFFLASSYSMHCLCSKPPRKQRYKEKFLKQRLFGDRIRQQKILSDFLIASVKFCPVGGSVAISSNRTKNSIWRNIDLIDLELRIKEQVIAVPEEVLAQMFQVDNEGQSEEGLTLVACRNLLSLMN
ncbi:hypothetical protein C2845_PM17G05390 [Panicum miliaceum]|uniref:Uncharacterized protein n=1 Tax=Panicum miliaceum TaxID=4540 RepID=A0A3L6Q3B9_PANMI|nr:hypothetical protein C2845_PM17G05390 [Panicum miliaceum]